VLRDSWVTEEVKAGLWGLWSSVANSQLVQKVSLPVLLLPHILSFVEAVSKVEDMAEATINHVSERGLVQSAKDGANKVVQAGTSCVDSVFMFD
jgi:hypothetical protein